MLLKSLKLKNFRQFKGEQLISFSTDKEQNVTVIMGDNGTGKTTLAQAFTWCLYGEVAFNDKILLCKAVSSDLLPNQKEKVRAELTLVHKEIEYTIISEQEYRKTDRADKPIESVGQRAFAISYKENGNFVPVPHSKLDGILREILPQELARYFFFDGENIRIMGDELSQGKGKEFARAVKSLLGLDAFTSAIDHLKKTVKDYDKKYDANSDSRIADYNRQISALDVQIEKIEARIAEIESEEILTREKIDKLKTGLEKSKQSEKIAQKKKGLIEKCSMLQTKKYRNVDELLSIFKQAPAYFSKKMMSESLKQLKDANKTDKSVPHVTADTIKHILERKRCICGTEVTIGDDAYNELNKLFDYIPPKSIGDSITDFRKICAERVRGGEPMFDLFKTRYADILSFDGEYGDIQDEISNIEEQLLGIDEDGIGKMQAELMQYETYLRNLNAEVKATTSEFGGRATDKKRIESERDTLTLKDENNRRVMTYKAYAQFMYDKLTVLYADEETKIRKKLEKTVNDIFHSILGEGFTLSLNDKYDVAVALSDLGGSSETSTAQNISIIFAFISGVIQIMRENQKDDGGLLISEPYPLVMDAPLSAFDKTRIQAVCDTLPKIAEQVIIFIKDADGDIAEQHLGSRIGTRLTFNAVSKVETYVR